MPLSVRLCRLLVLSLVASSLTVQAANEVTLNLKEAELESFIATVSEVTGKNFIIDEKVKGKVTVISSRPMSADAVYEVFLAVLQLKGFAAIPAGDAIKIVPETNARTDGGGFMGSGRGLPDDEVVTHVYQLENISAAQLVPILRPMVPQWGHLAAYAPSNVLIISDRAANVVRLERLILQMDQTGDREIELVRLQNAAASEVVRVLSSLSQADKQTDPTVRPAILIADERTNSVLIGGDKAERQKLLDIIRNLDIPLSDDGATQVVYLRYASAENLAPILEGYAQQQDQATAAQAGGQGGQAAAAAARPGAQSKVIADKDTNALIITAAPKTMRSIRTVIDQLDIRRPQVYVEAIIAEVSDSISSKLGIDFAAFNPDALAVAGIFDPATGAILQGLRTLGGSTTSSSNLNETALLGLLGQGLNVGGGNIDEDGTSFFLLLKALKGDGDTNILSTPSLVTLDNEEAKLSVGQEVPFLTGSFSNTGTGGNVGGSVNPFQTIQRKDIGLQLTLTPTVNEGNTIKLKVELEVSALAASSAQAADLITNKRTITNSVTVDNGQILVLGGLIDDSLTDSQTGVPFLSDIPVIGSLFTFNSVQKDKRNLMVFIRPQILRSRVESDYYTRRKYDYMRGVQVDSAEGAIPLIGGRRPMLPTLERYERDSTPPEIIVVPPPAVVVPAPPPAVPLLPPIDTPAPIDAPPVTSEQPTGDQAPPPPAPAEDPNLRPVSAPST